MGDLNQYQAAEKVTIVDGDSAADVISTAPTGTEGAIVTRNIPSGTQTVSGTLTSVPSGTQTVTGTVTLSSQTVTIGATTVTQPVSGTVTNVPSGTQTVTGTVSTNAETNIAPGSAPTRALVAGGVYNVTPPAPTNGQTLALQLDASGNLDINIAATAVTQPVSGTITAVPTGTQPVSGTVTLSSQTVTIGATTVTQPVSGTVTNVPSGTQTVTGTVSTNAETNIAPGSAPTRALVAGGVYNATPPAPTNGQTLALQLDASGNLDINIAATAVTQPVSGTVTAVPTGTQPVSGTVTLSSQTVTIGATTVTQPVSGTVTAVANAETNIAPGTAPSKALVIGAVYNTVAPAPTNGQTLALQADDDGNLKVNITGGPNASATLSQVTVSSATSTALLAANTARKMAIFFNNGSNFVYIKFGATASSTSYTIILYPGGLYEMPMPLYTGVIEALANSANNVINVTEM
jgi:uncharacterized membrane protein/co-chaperonin GroES (HSP10)